MAEAVPFSPPQQQAPTGVPAQAAPAPASPPPIPGQAGGAPAPSPAPGAPQTGLSLEQLVQKFSELEESMPELVQETVEDAREAGLAGPLLEQVGFLAARAISNPGSYPAVLQTIQQKIPQEAEAFPPTYEEAEELLYQLAFAAYLQDGGQI